MIPRRILIARLSHLGDVVCSLPLFHALRSAAPEAEIGWVVQREFAGLLQGLPGLDRVFLFDRSRGAANWLRLRRELRGFGADLAVDAQGNWKSAAVSFASGAAMRSGMARKDRREPSGFMVLNDSAPPMSSDQTHIVQRMLALSRHVITQIGSDPDLVVPRFDPALSSRERQRGKELADQFLPRSDRPPVVLHLATAGDVRSWPLDHFKRLAGLLLASGRSVLLLSGPAEKDHGHSLQRLLGTRPGLRHWIDQNHLREACAFFAECSERGIPMVVSDSGSMHLAASNGMRVVVLCGPQDAQRTGPWPSGPATPHTALRSLGELECAPCHARKCAIARDPVCMAELAPELVADTLELTAP